MNICISQLVFRNVVSFPIMSTAIQQIKCMQKSKRRDIKKYQRLQWQKLEQKKKRVANRAPNELLNNTNIICVLIMTLTYWWTWFKMVSWEQPSVSGQGNTKAKKGPTAPSWWLYSLVTPSAIMSDILQQEEITLMLLWSTISTWEKKGNTAVTWTQVTVKCESISGRWHLPSIHHLSWLSWGHH